MKVKAAAIKEDINQPANFMKAILHVRDKIAYSDIDLALLRKNTSPQKSPTKSPKKFEKFSLGERIAETGVSSAEQTGRDGINS